MAQVHRSCCHEFGHSQADRSSTWPRRLQGAARHADDHSVSNSILCRQCGASFPRADFSDVFNCPECEWSELLPKVFDQTAAPRSTRRKKRAKGDAGSADVPEFGLSLDAIRKLPAPDFERWVAMLLRRVGYMLEPLDDVGCILAERENVHRAVLCVWYGDREHVGRPECRQLLEQMDAAKTASGIIISPGVFESGCRTAVEEAAEERGGPLDIELIDGEALAATVDAMMTGPLAAWWSSAPRDAA